MPQEKDPTLRMFYIEDRGAAVVVGEKDGTEGVQFPHYIPRSQIGYAKKTANDKPGALQHYEFTIPEWLIEKKGLWKFVP
jgi:hypothetical protein